MSHFILKDRSEAEWEGAERYFAHVHQYPPRPVRMPWLPPVIGALVVLMVIGSNVL